MSDLMLGSFVGIMTGRKIEHYHHTHPGNKIDKLFLGVRPAPYGSAQLVLFEPLLGSPTLPHLVPMRREREASPPCGG